jgi:hypothetical protein
MSVHATNIIKSEKLNRKELEIKQPYPGTLTKYLIFRYISKHSYQFPIYSMLHCKYQESINNDRKCTHGE